jgi:uncharacterized protein with HEPN domain
MTRHNDEIRLRHMLDHAKEAVEMVRGRERDDFNRDRMLQLAIVRLVEIIGEAATRVSPEGQQQYGSVPWQQARGMRNRLIHGYDRVDLDILWNTVQDDLPVLIAQLQQALGKSDNDGAVI